MFCKDITGVILAGGENRRYYGFNKAFLSINGEKIIDRTIRILQKFFPEILIITNKPYIYLNYPNVIKDLIVGIGPIGGLYTALNVAKTELVFVTACDMPFIKESLIKKIIANIGEITVPVSRKGYEPLFGIYSKKVLPQVESKIKNGNFSIHTLFGNFQTKFLKLSDSESKSLFNVNSPDDMLLISKSMGDKGENLCQELLHKQL